MAVNRNNKFGTQRDRCRVRRQMDGCPRSAGPHERRCGKRNQLAGKPRNRAVADVVGAGDVADRLAVRAPLDRLALLVRVRFGGRPMRWPRTLARARPSAMRVRIRSRSTSASPPSTGEQVEGRAGEPVDPRHRHHVAGAEGLQHPQELAPVSQKPAVHFPVPTNTKGAEKLMAFINAACARLEL